MKHPVRSGDVVRVHYTGRVKDGDIFETTVEGEPLQFEVGAGKLLPGFEGAVMGLSEGDQVTVTLTPSQGYGEHLDELMVNVPLEEFPNDIRPEPGLQLQVVDQEGGAALVLVTDVDDDSVVLDANHPLAGLELEFDIELIEIVE